MSDAVDLLLDCEFVEVSQWQRQEQADSSLQDHEGVEKRFFNLCSCSINCRRVGHAPMSSHRLSRPYRTDFFCSVVADREHKVQLWSTRSGKLVPVFTS